MPSASLIVGAVSVPTTWNARPESATPRLIERNASSAERPTAPRRIQSLTGVLRSGSPMLGRDRPEGTPWITVSRGPPAIYDVTFAIAALTHGTTVVGRATKPTVPRFAGELPLPPSIAHARNVRTASAVFASGCRDRTMRYS